MRDATVVVQGGRILELGAGPLPAPAAAETLDLSGRHLVPGLIDAHVHAEDPAVLRVLLEAGITTIRNPGPMEPSVRQRGGPRVLHAGRYIDGAGSLVAGAVQVSTEQEARREVGRQAEQGVDLVKLYQALGPALVRAAVDEAHERGLVAVGDLVATGWTEAARAGIDFLCHAVPRHPALLPQEARSEYLRRLRQGDHPICSWVELLDLEAPPVQQMIDALARGGVAVDPTLVSLEAMLFAGDPEYHDSLGAQGEEPPRLAPDRVAQLRERARPVWRKTCALVRRLHRGGVRILCGTDAPRAFVAPGASLHRELVLLAGAGLSPLEALMSATGGAADLLGLGGEVGSIRPGARADLVLLDRDPMADLRHTASVCWVMQGGGIVAR